MITLRQALRERILFFDGAMGTLIHSANLPKVPYPEMYNITHPETITGIHKQYLDAGSTIISACTFGAYAHKLDNLPAIVTAAVQNAKTAIAESGHTDCFVALDMGPTGKLLEPIGDTPFETVYNIFKETAMLGAKNGADCVIIETMIDFYETKAAVLAVKENTDLPVFCSATFEKSGRTLTGGTPLAFVTLMEGLGVDAIGLNCGAGPDFAAPIAAEIVKYASIPVLVQPNAGLPRMVDGHAEFDLTAADFATDMEQICRAGVRLLGGCCGTTPAHIQALIARCANIAPAQHTPEEAVYICTCGESYRLSGTQPECGILSAVEPDVLAALQSNDMDEIADIAIEHKADGADILVLRLGAPGVDEAAIMKGVINAIQQAAPIPMLIETDNAAALRIALRLLNGKAAIRLLADDALLRQHANDLVARYGGALVE